MMAVPISAAPALEAGNARVLFEGEFLPSIFPQTGTAYDVSPDGQRFLMVEDIETKQPAASIAVVLNWFDELRRRVPVE